MHQTYRDDISDANYNYFFIGAKVWYIVNATYITRICNTSQMVRGKMIDKHTEYIVLNGHKSTPWQEDIKCSTPDKMRKNNLNRY